MTITELVDMARRIHDTEGHNLGENSTRDTRNAYWMRVVGCVHWGHPAYNPTPDPRWHVKDGGGGRPMSDDVAVLMPSREAWDCIPGAGANGYRFEADAIGALPAAQHVYAPDRPGDAGPVPVPVPPTPPPAAGAIKPRAQFFLELIEINAFYAAADGLQRQGGMVIMRDGVLSADVEALGSWGYDLLTGGTVEGALAAIQQSDEYKQKHPGGTP